MIFKYFLAGFVSKSIASFDDTITRIPIIAHLTKTLKGRIAFSIGTLLAVTIACFFAWLLSSFLKQMPNTNLFASGLIFCLAIAVYFDLFAKKVKVNKKVKIVKQVATEKFYKIFFLGFFISLITLIDDFVVLTPLFLNSTSDQIYALIGIYTSTILQLLIVVYLAKYLENLKYVKEIAVGGLLTLSFITYLNGI